MLYRVINMLISPLLLLTLLMSHGLTVKTNEVKNNDSPFTMIGEVTSAIFFKNKINFISKFNVIGQINKFTGEVVSRIKLADREKIVHQDSESIVVSTKLSELVYYNLIKEKQTVDYRFVVDNHTTTQLQDILKIKDKEYVLFNTTLYYASAKEHVLKFAEESQQFFSLLAMEEGQLAIFSRKYLALCIELYPTVGNYTINVSIPSSSDTFSAHYIADHIIVSFYNETLIYNNQLAMVDTINKPLIDTVNNILIFYDHNYDMYTMVSFKGYRPIKSSRPDANVTLLHVGSSLVIQRDSSQIAVIKDNQQIPILRAWLNFRTDLDYYLLVQYIDLELVLFDLTKHTHNQLWSREYSLAEINKVVFMKHTLEDGLDNLYHRNLIKPSYRNLPFIAKLALLPRDLYLRLVEYVALLKDMLVGMVNYVVDIAKHFKLNFNKLEMSEEQYMRYGLHKYLIIITNRNTIFSIDTKTKYTLWKKRTNYGPNNNLISLIKMKYDYKTETTVQIRYNEERKYVNIEEIHKNGTILLLKNMIALEMPTVHKLSDHALAIKSGKSIQRFELVTVEGHNYKQYYFYTVEDSRIVGWKMTGESAKEIWTFYVGKDERIIATASAFRGYQSSFVPLVDNNTVIFKNLDFTNFAVVTSQSITSLSLWILNGRNGKVHFNEYKEYVNLKLEVSLVYDENNVFVSYFNARNKIFEIWAVEAFQERIEVSAVNMITDYLSERQYKSENSSYNIIFLSYLYGSPMPIKTMFISESKMSLIRRNLFVITKENYIYMIGRYLVSTRRPGKRNYTYSYFFNSNYPPYSYILPFHAPSCIINQNIKLLDLNQIRFSSTDLESSIFLFAYGIDSFLIRLDPDKNFDRITEKFQPLYLLGIITIILLLCFVLKRMIKKAVLKKPFLE